MLGLNICQLHKNNSIPSTSSSEGTTYSVMNLDIHPTTIASKKQDFIKKRNWSHRILENQQKMDNATRESPFWACPNNTFFAWHSCGADGQMLQAGQIGRLFEPSSVGIHGVKHRGWSLIAVKHRDHTESLACLTVIAGHWWQSQWVPSKKNNISHQTEKENHRLKSALGGDMLVPWE